jgi:carbamoylphosphate synthase small subunit
MEAILALEDGTWFSGAAAGATGETGGGSCSTPA